ncbi:uncharacterized protein LOC118435814 [Folsomia candida]|uniref:uncharacterized protein LOC118435814 n=1 Tax=Folsomia candida TaxID=158441 RepID=UPI001604B8C2|nr:uncharacterized protein LOC118435814 [Folsomia candida]
MINEIDLIPKLEQEATGDDNNLDEVVPKKGARVPRKPLHKLTTQQAVLKNENGTYWSFYKVELAYKTTTDNPIPIHYYKGSNMFLEIEAVKKTARLASYSPHGIVHYQDVIVDWDESKRAEYEFICTDRPSIILKVKQLYFFFMLKSSKDFDSVAKVSFFF